MRHPARLQIMLWAAAILVCLALLSIPLFIREADVAAWPPLVVSLAVVIVGLVVLVRKRRDRAWMRDTWLALNSQPRTNLALAVVGACAGFCGVALGIGLLLFVEPVAVGATSGWTIIVCGAGTLALVLFMVWVARRPYDAAGVDNAAGTDPAGTDPAGTDAADTDEDVP